MNKKHNSTQFQIFFPSQNLDIFIYLPNIPPLWYFVSLSLCFLAIKFAAKPLSAGIPQMLCKSLERVSLRQGNESISRLLVNKTERAKQGAECRVQRGCSSKPTPAKSVSQQQHCVSKRVIKREREGEQCRLKSWRHWRLSAFVRLQLETHLLALQLAAAILSTWRRPKRVSIVWAACCKQLHLAFWLRAA